MRIRQRIQELPRRNKAVFQAKDGQAASKYADGSFHYSSRLTTPKFVAPTVLGLIIKT
jgi:hypothetical protein